MRLLASLLAILLVVLAAGFWTNHSLQQSTKDLSRQIERVSQEIKQEQWEAAHKQNRQLERTWQEKARWWPIILDHQEIDNIEFSLAKIKEYVASHDLPLALGQLSELKLMIEHIPRKEAVNLENIL
ncbi:DUF4363 family protein [Syntrophomonas wolfei]|jgi:hypothetical protein|uniref:DUF4363 domain-containing protein n=1 Tax=Syntrophomonas wolfei TaxID=863 RepID=A0A354YXF2_9FIRM|nr:DUF4363 family protein [Syntrophomonas wolfei]HBK53391.1 DUF4363 domain-containing protein [Syntrophomonas wolfei]